MRRITTAIALLAVSAAALWPTGCSTEPDSVLQSDLPQIPGMTPRDSSGLRQSEGRVTAGQFSYKGPISNLNARANETMARFDQAGWKLSSQTLSASTANLIYRKDNRTVRSATEPTQHGFGRKRATSNGAIDGAVGDVVAGNKHAVIYLSGWSRVDICGVLPWQGAHNAIRAQ